MCGILGTIPSSDNRVFAAALSTTAHRGPDGSDVWHCTNGQISLGHNRLSIQDLTEKGRQPLFYNRFVITYNGEIYNFRELKDQLKAKGHKFYTETDTEVIVAAYLEWGEDALLKFNGMWAFALWDTLTQKLILCRDRYGKKPLFYAILNNGTFVFASEMKAILPFLKEIRPSADFDWCKKTCFYMKAPANAWLRAFIVFLQAISVIIKKATGK